MNQKPNQETNFNQKPNEKVYIKPTRKVKQNLDSKQNPKVNDNQDFSQN